MLGDMLRAREALERKVITGTFQRDPSKIAQELQFQVDYLKRLNPAEASRVQTEITSHNARHNGAYSFTVFIQNYDPATGLFRGLGHDVFGSSVLGGSVWSPTEGQDSAKIEMVKLYSRLQLLPDVQREDPRETSVKKAWLYSGVITLMPVGALHVSEGSYCSFEDNLGAAGTWRAMIIDPDSNQALSLLTKQEKSR